LETFGVANGARTLDEMRARIKKYRRKGPDREDYTIGCILLERAGKLHSSNGEASSPNRSLTLCLDERGKVLGRDADRVADADMGATWFWAHSL
jgi:hypothetical protein